MNHFHKHVASIRGHQGNRLWLPILWRRLSEAAFNNYVIPYYKCLIGIQNKNKNIFFNKKYKNYRENSILKHEAIEIFKDIFFEFILRNKYTTLSKLDDIMKEIIIETENIISEDLKIRNDLLKG
mgnify:CR=1 FL=1